MYMLYIFLNVLIYRVIFMSRDKKAVFYKLRCVVVVVVCCHVYCTTLCSCCQSIGHTFTFMISLTYCMKACVCF